MKSILVVYHSMTGGTRQMAEAMTEAAASEEGVTVALKLAQKADEKDLMSADGYVFLSPENLAAMVGMMKDFFDRTYYPVLGKIQGRPCVIGVCAGSDGSNATRQLQRIAKGWRLKEVCDPLIVCTHAQTPEEILSAKTIGHADLGRCREAALTLALGLSNGIF